MKGTRGVRIPLKISTSVFRGSVERSLLPSAVFPIFSECRPKLKTRKSLLQAVCHWNVAGKARKKRKKTASFVASLRWRTAAIERITCDLSCLSAIRDNLLLCLPRWPSKRKPRHCGDHESTGKSDQESMTVSTISSGQLWLILQLLIARECFWGEAEREWWEAEVTSALHCVLWETKHPSARSPQWKGGTKQ